MGGFAASKIGRKWGLIAATIPLFIGWILIAVAKSVAYLFAGRIFWGLSVGMTFTISPMYCAEIATVRCFLKIYLKILSSPNLIIFTCRYQSFNCVNFTFITIFFHHDSAE